MGKKNPKNPNYFKEIINYENCLKASKALVSRNELPNAFPQRKNENYKKICAELGLNVNKDQNLKKIKNRFFDVSVQFVLITSLIQKFLLLSEILEISKRSQRSTK